MSEAGLTELGLAAGVWRARLAGSAAPEVQVTHRGVPVPGVTLAADGEGGWVLSVPVPAESLSDGVQTYVITQAGSGVRLGGFSIAAGAVLEGDLRAEIELMRAELDMLKAAFRRLAAKVG